MREYKSLKKGSINFDELPSEAMMFDGRYLEDEIEGYQTLTVSGRELMAYNVDSQPVSGNDGNIFISARLPSRTISVRYQMKARNPEEMRKKYNLMNRLLSKKQAVISFNDEKEYEFIGTFSGSSEVPEGRLSVVGSFDIICSDPYKYKKSDEHSGIGSLDINQRMYEPVVLDEIMIEPENATNVYEIINETRDLKIRLINASSSSESISIYPKDQKIIRGGESVPHLLDWTSDLENFEVFTGDEIKVVPGDSKITIRLRERLR